MGFPYGETITLRRSTGTGQDGDGNDVPVYTAATSSGWAIAPASATEAAQGQQMLITGLTAIINEAVPAAGIDRVTIDTGPYAGAYDIDGMPGAYVSALTGRPVTAINLKRVTG